MRWRAAHRRRRRIERRRADRPPETYHAAKIIDVGASTMFSIFNAIFGPVTPERSEDGKTWTYTPQPAPVSLTISGDLTKFGEQLLRRMLGEELPIEPLDGCAICGGQLPYEPMLVIDEIKRRRVAICRGCQAAINAGMEEALRRACL